MLSSPKDNPTVLVFGAVEFIWKFRRNHPERGHRIAVGYEKAR